MSSPEEPQVTLPIMFKVRDLVLHPKSGNTYRISISPRVGTLEKTREPAYSYYDVNSPCKVHHRCQSEMEDGRFKIVDSVTDLSHLVSGYNPHVVTSNIKRSEEVVVPAIQNGKQ